MRIKKRAVRYALSVENGCRRHPTVPLGTVCEPTHSVPNGTRRAGVFAAISTDIMPLRGSASWQGRSPK
ncbi:MAG: hypothetical protein LBF19_03360 [Prevotellaceae bacterium]|nr:hypothetical protein [Prevotellaceae bacterium]